MEKGKRYRVRFRLGLQQKDREFVGTFLGMSGLTDMVFDLRPDAGTATLPSTAMQKFTEVDKTVNHHQPRIVNE